MIQITSATPNPIPAGGTITITVTGGPIDGGTAQRLPRGPIQAFLGNNANSIVLGPFAPGQYQITVTAADGSNDSINVIAN